MKKLHLIFTLAAFLAAGIGVFATEYSKAMVTTFSVDDPTNMTADDCLDTVDGTCSGPGSDCRFSGTSNENHTINDKPLYVSGCTLASGNSFE